MTDDLQDIDLDALSDDELIEQMHNDLYDGMRDEIVEGTNILLKRGYSATQVLDDALVAGMKIVGIDFRDGILFVPEVLLAANAMKAGMEILRPLLAETGAEMRLPRDSQARATELGVLVWYPSSKPESATLYDPSRWSFIVGMPTMPRPFSGPARAQPQSKSAVLRP